MNPIIFQHSHTSVRLRVFAGTRASNQKVSMRGSGEASYS